MKNAILILILAANTAYTQTGQTPPAEEHIRNIVKELPADSPLRRQLLEGARGTGTHDPWMDEMRRQGIKRAVVSIDIRFDKKGRPAKMNPSRIDYFDQYEKTAALSDVKRVEQARTSGLENQLNTSALVQAERGFWTDVPRPVLRPFVGGTNVEFFDDEWLPVQAAPMFYARRTD